MQQTPLSSVPELGDAFLRGVEAAHAVASPQQFFLWLRMHLHRFVPHELALCWADGGREAGGRRAQVLNCVPLPESLSAALSDPAGALWPPLAQLWERAEGQACQVQLRHLANDDDVANAAARALVTGLADAGFSALQLHGIGLGMGPGIGPGGRGLGNGIGQPHRAGPELLFAFLRHGATANDSSSGEDSTRPLMALELWMPYLQFAWCRAEAGAARRQPRPAPGVAPLLTARELQVLTAVRDAKANAQIGVLLGISPLTVKNHLRSIQRKLGARNRAHAVAEAMARRLIA